MKIKKALKSRANAIHDKVNLLEKLHKTCQLTTLGIASPILNETRYLSRALADMLHHQDSNKLEYMKALGTAELAVHSAINDAVDILITYVKNFSASISRDYPKFNFGASSYGPECLAVLQHICELDHLVIYSRENRHERYQTYKKLVDSPFREKLEKVANFALKLRLIEATAQSVQNGGANAPHDEVIANALFAALSGAQMLGTAVQPQLEMYLQPKYKLNAGVSLGCIGAEALLRLSAGGQSISPDIFIRVAERAQLISSVGIFVMKNALTVLNANPTLSSISVNVSAHELLSPNYSDTVLDLLTQHGVTPDRLELEITEGAVIADLDSARHLERLSAAGVAISIDDFGTGETRFDYIAEIPLNTIKIDRSIVNKYIATPNKHGKLVRAIVAIAGACNLKLIAEGLENTPDVQALEQLGITDFQGYLFGKPESVSKFIAAHSPSFI